MQCQTTEHLWIQWISCCDFLKEAKKSLSQRECPNLPNELLSVRRQDLLGSKVDQMVHAGSFGFSASLGTVPYACQESESLSSHPPTLCYLSLLGDVLLVFTLLEYY